MHIFHSYHVQTMSVHEFAGICLYVDVHTCLDHVYTMYIHGMYNFTLPCRDVIEPTLLVPEKRISDLPPD